MPTALVPQPNSKSTSFRVHRGRCTSKIHHVCEEKSKEQHRFAKGKCPCGQANLPVFLAMCDLLRVSSRGCVALEPKDRSRVLKVATAQRTWSARWHWNEASGQDFAAGLAAV